MKRILDIHKKSAALTVAHPAELLLFKIFSAAIVIFACTYVYLVAATALNVIASREASARAATLESAVGTMQQQYFALSQAAAAAAPASLGLAPITETSFVYRPTTVGLVSPADNAN